MHETIEEAIKRITETVPLHTVRDATNIEVGQVVHQGDIYLHRVADDHPRGELLGTRKLAVGQGDGSHHMAEGESVEVYAGAAFPAWVSEPKWVKPNALLGPVVVARGPWMNTHPKHAHHALPSGCYQVTYQADALTRRRQVD